MIQSSGAARCRVRGVSAARPAPLNRRPRTLPRASQMASVGVCCSGRAVARPVMQAVRLTARAGIWARARDSSTFESMGLGYTAGVSYAESKQDLAQALLPVDGRALARPISLAADRAPQAT